MARRLKRAALVAAVVAAHVVLIDQLGALMAGPAAERMPERLTVTWVRTMTPTAPPPRAVAPPAPPPPSPPRRLASTLALEPAWREAAIERTERVEHVERAEAAVPAPPPPAAVAEAAPPFEWPESTRLRYRVGGNYRGEVHGSAEVEWIRAGSRYQVHLDVVVGLPIAPLFSRRMSSDGTLTPQGLYPRRYDEDTQIAFRDRRRVSIDLGDALLRWPRGRIAERPPELQDSASQFVQIAWLLAMRPELAQPGARLELPLALPRYVLPWAYEVVGEEIVQAGFGPVPALHLKPAQPPRPGDLGAEAWFAPGFRWLPVRILIRQDDETYVDLVLASLPELGNATSAALR